MKHPFAELLDITFVSHGEGKSLFSIEISEKHMNPNGVVHGGVIYSLADNGMGAAMHSVMGEGMMCATIELKINYFRPVFKGLVECKTQVIFKGRRTATLESDLFCDEKQVAKALGTFAIMPVRK